MLKRSPDPEARFRWNETRPSPSWHRRWRRWRFTTGHKHECRERKRKRRWTSDASREPWFRGLVPCCRSGFQGEKNTQAIQLWTPVVWSRSASFSLSTPACASSVDFLSVSRDGMNRFPIFWEQVWTKSSDFYIHVKLSWRELQPGVCFERSPQLVFDGWKREKTQLSVKCVFLSLFFTNLQGSHV